MESRLDLIDALQLYVSKGILPNSFLRFVLSNDLVKAVGTADEEARLNMYEIISYIYNELPAFVWGSDENVMNYSYRKHQDWDEYQEHIN
jgi:hypothetical protein